MLSSIKEAWANLGNHLGMLTIWKSHFRGTIYRKLSGKWKGACWSADSSVPMDSLWFSERLGNKC